MLRRAKSVRRVIRLLCAAFVALACARGPALSEHELAALKSVEGIVRLFERQADAIWPGFDLSQRPFLVYVPEKWALLLNPPPGARDFGPLPEAWPRLAIRAGYRAGAYRDLAGQLAFDFDVGGAKIAAVGLIEGQFEAFGPRTATMFGFIVHEAFHQFQSESFGEIPWEREERYPILDADNTALAALEMEILRDAVAAELGGDRGKAEGLLKMFVAVRTERWAKASPFVGRYEQGQEVREGTAAYVEKKSLDLARSLKYGSTLDGITAPLHRDLEPFPASELFRRDFAARLTDGAVSPDDMIRNRIYPVGSALGFLADLWGPGWKKDLVANVGTFSFRDFFREKLGVGEADVVPLASAAMEKYGYASILESAAKLIAGYRSGFEKDKAEFEAQAGTRIEIRVRYRSISRSRSSQGRSWVVDDGKRALLTKVRVYSLKMDGLSLQARDAAIYEENDWDAKDKRVAFFANEAPSVAVDGAKAALGGKSGPIRFGSIELTGPNVTLLAKIPGTLMIEGGRIFLEFPLPGPDLRIPSSFIARQ